MKRNEVERTFRGTLIFELARGIRRPLFILSEYEFFRGGGAGSSALVLDLPWPFWLASMLLHILESHAITLLKLPCYYVKVNMKTLGLFAYQENHESLRVASLAVRRQFRRLGIGESLLHLVETTARKMHKKWLEVDVLKKNVPARRLYTNYGFTLQQRSGNRRIMRGRKSLKNQ